jgi:hypothetical protein
VLVAIASAFFASCSGGDGATAVPAAPTQPPATQPPFRNLAGTWKGTGVELVGDRRTSELTIVFTQPAGSTTLTGTVTERFGGTEFPGTITSGSLTDLMIDLKVGVLAHDANRTPIEYWYSGVVDNAGTEMHGDSGLAIFRNRSGTWSVRR